jgi:hypothetical protein
MKNLDKKTILGFVILPLFIAAYLFDRLIQVPLIWMPGSTVTDWLQDNEQIKRSFARIIIFWTPILVWNLIKLIFA